MGAEEMAQPQQLSPAASGQAAVEVAGASFAWQQGAEPLLRDVDLKGGLGLGWVGWVYWVIFG